MSKNIPHSIKAPWLRADSPEIDKTVGQLVSVVQKHKSARPPTLDKGKKKVLTRLFKNAGLARSDALKYMTALAKKMGSQDPSLAAILAPMKDIGRATHKFFQRNEPITDLGRGRIYVSSPEEVFAFYKTLDSRNKDGQIKGFGALRAKIDYESITDYLREARRSGYCGSINFELEVDIGRAETGFLEVQIMPWDYKDAYDHSHALYDFIRILEEHSEYFEADTRDEIHKALLLANRCIFDEYALRTGFMCLREDQTAIKVSKEDLQSINDTLDRLRTQIERMPGRKLSWRKKAADAMTYAKTSALNLYLSDSKILPQHTIRP